MGWLSYHLDFMRVVFKKLMLVCVAWLVYWATDWSMSYANSRDPSTDVATVIAAVHVPIITLMGYAAKLYMEYRE